MTAPWSAPSIPAYAAHESFVAPARYRCQIGRLLIGILLAELLFAFGMSGLDRLLLRVSPSLADAVYYGDTGVALILQLLSFGMLGLALMLIVTRLHLRRPVSLFGPWDRMRLMFPAFFGAAAVYVLIQILPPWIDFHGIESHRNIAAWIALLPFALLALLVQTGAEEMFYRGYIQQQIAARLPDPRVWLILPNLLFAWVHWEQGAETVDNLRYVIWAFCFGLACSDLTARSGSLGPAIGLHMANNAYAFLFFADAGALDSGLALFLYPELTLTEPQDTIDAIGPVVTPQLLMELALILVAWLATRLAIRR
ncbi:hypothetical protein PSAL_030410 [Pseudooceanicola algae]|uniref:CAAX prenyl protease 2/Lysostaphin resistance protein A-like domain-containing protein n=2 Tax=Pseudooceanicola algae TaxID=1537215 RepID=A0A418SGI0_9RHOB|nr:hypothetical protein PSAL_030410 [Pseudooceanicola algae]